MLNPPTRTLGLNSNKVKPLQSVFISTKAEHSTFDLLVLVRCSSTIYSLTTVPVLVSWSSGIWWLIAGLLLPGNGDLACLPSPHVLCGVNPPFFLRLKITDFRVITYHTHIPSSDQSWKCGNSILFNTFHSKNLEMDLAELFYHLLYAAFW